MQMRHNVVKHSCFEKGSILQVLQQSVDRELNMYSDLKERTNKVAQIMMLSLSSQPVDHEENGRFKLRSTELGKIPS